MNNKNELRRSDPNYLSPTVWEWSLTDRPLAWEFVTRIPVPAAGSTVNIDLSRQVVDPQMFEIRITGATISAAHPFFEGSQADDRFLIKQNDSTYLINRTQAVASWSTSALRLTIGAITSDSFAVYIRPFTGTVHVRAHENDRMPRDQNSLIRISNHILSVVSPVTLSRITLYDLSSRQIKSVRFNSATVSVPLGRTGGAMLVAIRYVNGGRSVYRVIVSNPAKPE